MKQALTLELEHRLVEKAKSIVANEAVAAHDKLSSLCLLLHDQVRHYDWVGFYLALPRTRELLLSAYVGAPTDHYRIAYGTGICGQAASTLRPFVVQDVAKEENYLSCSIHVKSEVVLPVFYEGAFVGELDIDSHSQSPFSEGDTRLLTAIAYLAAPCVAELSANTL